MAELRVVLAGPEAAAGFDPDRLSPRDLERWRKGVARDEKRREFMASRALLAAEGLVGFEFGPGRHASLTHSHGHAALVAAPAGWRVGIDLEWQQPRDIPGLESWCYSDAELAVASTAPDDVRADQFHVRWAIKEAGLKALGLRFPGGLREVEVEFVGDRPVRVGSVHAPGLRTWVWRPRAECVMAVVAEAGEGVGGSCRATMVARDATGAAAEWVELLAPP